jgi:hypothetical protein
VVKKERGHPRKLLTTGELARPAILDGRTPTVQSARWGLRVETIVPSFDHVQRVAVIVARAVERTEDRGWKGESR